MLEIMKIRDVTARVLVQSRRAHTAVEICQLVQELEPKAYQVLMGKYKKREKVEDEIYKEAVRVFKLPATSLPRAKIESNYRKGDRVGKAVTLFWVTKSARK